MLPPELIDLILDYLHDDIEALGACAAAGRPLLHTSRRHRFNGCHLNYIRAARLEPVLESSSALARSIKSLVYHPFARAPGDYVVSPPVAVAILRLLPKLIDLRIQAQALPCIIDLGCRLSCLRLDDVWTEPRQVILFMLSMFFNLEELELSDPYPMPRLDKSDRYTDGSSAPRVRRKLSFRNTGCAEMITKWFSATGRVPPLLSVTYTIRGESHARLFAAQSRTLAPLVRELEIVFKPDGTMQGALESVDLTLASYAALQSCTLRFALPEMCVAENTSLAWIPTIISQLSSASLGSLSISLVVDNVEDLRSLNSECAVRVLTTAYFDDLQDLDWVAMSQALSAERLEGLRKVVFEGCGRRELLEEHIMNTCPELHARGIVSLVAVAKEAAWAD